VSARCWHARACLHPAARLPRAPESTPACTVLTTNGHALVAAILWIRWLPVRPRRQAEAARAGLEERLAAAQAALQAQEALAAALTERAGALQANLAAALAGQALARAAAEAAGAERDALCARLQARAPGSRAPSCLATPQVLRMTRRACMPGSACGFMFGTPGRAQERDMHAAGFGCSRAVARLCSRRIVQR